MAGLPFEIPGPLLEALKTARKVLLATHVNPDADGMGSLLACGLALQESGVEVSRLGEPGLAATLSTLPGSTEIPVDDGKASFDLGILFDCHEERRLGDGARALGRCRSVAVIDHHPVGDDGTVGNLPWIEPTASSTTLMVLRLLEHLVGDEGIGPDIASNLYAGLVVDTGGFRHPGTTAFALHAAGYLVERGADSTGLTYRLLHRRRPEAIALLASVFADVRYELSGRAALIAVTQERLGRSGATVEEAEGLISIASAIDGVVLSAMHIEESPRRWRVSLRARPPAQVALIARERGGGGHVLAAGFSAEGDLPVLQRDLVAAFERELRTDRDKA